MMRKRITYLLTILFSIVFLLGMQASYADTDFGSLTGNGNDNNNNDSSVLLPTTSSGLTVGEQYGLYGTLIALGLGGIGAFIASHSSHDPSSNPTPTYNITSSTDGNGAISYNNSTASSQTVAQNSRPTFNIIPNNTFVVADVQVDGTSVGPVSSYTFAPINANHTIRATFVAPNSHYIIATINGDNGTLTPSGVVAVQNGFNKTFLATANTGYDITDVKLDGVSQGPQTSPYSYTFTGVTSDHTIDVTITIHTYTITAIQAANGAITPAGATGVQYMGSQTYAITASAGYYISDVIIDGTTHLGPQTSSYTFSSVSANHTISATFALNPVIAATAGLNGTISPSGSVSVSYGGNQPFTMTPSAGYHVVDVLVDSSSVGAVTSYPFTDVTANHTISVTFAINTYTITPSAGSGGSISPSTPQTVNYGGSQTFTMTPSAGYHVVDVLVDSSSVGAVTSYPFTDVTANHTISVTFAINTYTITAVQSSNGTITPVGATTVNYGGSQQYTVTAASGYTITDVAVTINGTTQHLGPQSNPYSYTFTNVQSDCSITATFALNVHNITVTQVTGEGTIAPGTTIVPDGGSQEFTVTPNSPQYRTTNIVVNGGSYYDPPTYTFSNVHADQSITATYALNPYITVTQGSNGTITPGSSYVVYGQDQTFVLSPNSNYYVAYAAADGAQVALDSPSAVPGSSFTYTFHNVTANHTFAADFTSAGLLNIVQSSSSAHPSAYNLLSVNTLPTTGYVTLKNNSNSSYGSITGLRCSASSVPSGLTISPSCSGSSFTLTPGSSYTYTFAYTGSGASETLNRTPVFLSFTNDASRTDSFWINVVDMGQNYFFNPSALATAAHSIYDYPITSGLTVTANGTHIIYVGTNGGGIFESTDNGVNWMLTTNSYTTPAPKLNVTSLLYVNESSPLYINYHNILYAGTSDGYVMSSPDGFNWTIGPQIGSSAVVAFVTDGTNLFATVGTQVFKSTNGGAAWGPFGGELAQNLTALVYDGSANLYAGTYGAGVFQSLSSGSGSWSGFNGTAPYNLTNLDVTSLVYDSDEVLYAGTDGGYVFGTSTTGPATWNQYAGGLSDGHIVSLMYDGTTYLYAGTNTGGVSKSIAGGSLTWSSVGSLTPAALSLLTDGTNLYAGTNSNGMFQSPVSSPSWTSLTTAINSKAVYAVYDDSGALPSNNHLFAGAGINGVYESTDNGANWLPINSGLSLAPACGMYVSSLAYDGTNTLYAGLATPGYDRYGGSNGGIYSANINSSPVTWNPTGNFDVPSGSTSYRSVLSLLYNDSSNFYAGIDWDDTATVTLYKYHSSQNPPWVREQTNGTLNMDSILSLAHSHSGTGPSSNDIYYAGTYGWCLFVMQTVSGSIPGEWNRVPNDCQTNTLGAVISSLVYDTNSGYLYAGTKYNNSHGVEPVSPQGVIRIAQIPSSTDDFTEANLGLPPVDILALATGGLNIYAGTSGSSYNGGTPGAGLYIATPSSSSFTWTAFNTGFPSSPYPDVLSLQHVNLGVGTYDKWLYVGTRGQGLYMADVQ